MLVIPSYLPSKARSSRSYVTSPHNLCTILHRGTRELLSTFLVHQKLKGMDPMQRFSKYSLIPVLDLMSILYMAPLAETLTVAHMPGAQSRPPSVPGDHGGSLAMQVAEALALTSGAKKESSEGDLPISRIEPSYHVPKRYSRGILYLKYASKVSC